jgi:thioester reductase-like protein
LIAMLAPSKEFKEKESHVNVLLTGASGLLGTALLESVPDNTHVIALRHRSPLVDGASEALSGDIRQPRLGLSESDYKTLAARIDVIIHSASITSFGVSDARMLETNVAGTRTIAELALHAQARLLYVSTAFVHPAASEIAPASMYEDSKRQAEAVVQSLDDFVIVRPSIIVGDSRTGRVAVHQGLHEMVGSMIDRTLPVLPARPGMLCDFVAQNWVADAIWAAAAHARPDRELWITSGAHALTVDAIVSLAVKMGEAHGFRGSAPRIVPYDTLQRLFIPVFLESLPGPMKRRFRAHLKLARYMNQVDPLPSSEAYLQRAFGLARREAPMTVLTRNMEQWVAQRRAAVLRTPREREPVPAAAS